jgi:two-component system, NarL family, response regulator LiaR
MATDERIRVIIVDDHTLVREALASLLRSLREIELVGVASSGEEAIKLGAQLRPDVVLMDLMMPGINGIAATQEIRRDFPQTQVIILTSFIHNIHVQAARNAGAVGCLSKGISTEELADAISKAKRGLSLD